MNEIMVLPRECFRGLDGFVSWSNAGKLVDSVSSYAKWMPRPEAERCDRWVQPIPSAIFRDSGGRYCVFRQPRQPRKDLSRRVSLIVGGHIDRDCDNEIAGEVFEETIKREVLEEVGINLDCPLIPVGIVVDATSIVASKHVGFVYETVVDRKIKPLNSEEFAVRSKYNGQFISVEALSELSSMLDPWSTILYYQYLKGGFPIDMGRQSKFLVPSE